jgi:hypothetical protein
VADSIDSIAGAEPVASFLAGTLYYILKDQDIYRTLIAEVRNAFAKEEEISHTRLQKLEYLQAVISEALRMYPPAVHNSPRISPGAYVDGQYIPRGVSQSFSSMGNTGYFPNTMVYTGRGVHQYLGRRSQRSMAPRTKPLRPQPMDQTTKRRRSQSQSAIPVRTTCMSRSRV